MLLLLLLFLFLFLFLSKLKRETFFPVSFTQNVLPFLCISTSKAGVKKAASRSTRAAKHKSNDWDFAKIFFFFFFLSLKEKYIKTQVLSGKNRKKSQKKYFCSKFSLKIVLRQK